MDTGSKNVGKLLVFAIVLMALLFSINASATAVGGSSSSLKVNFRPDPVRSGDPLYIGVAPGSLGIYRTVSFYRDPGYYVGNVLLPCSSYKCTSPVAATRITTGWTPGRYYARIYDYSEKDTRLRWKNFYFVVEDRVLQIDITPSTVESGDNLNINIVPTQYGVGKNVDFYNSEGNKVGNLLLSCSGTRCTSPIKATKSTKGWAAGNYYMVVQDLDIRGRPTPKTLNFTITKSNVCAPSDGTIITIGQGPFSEGDYLVLEGKIFRYEDASRVGGVSPKLNLKLVDSECNPRIISLNPVAGTKSLSWDTLNMKTNRITEIKINPDSNPADTDVFSGSGAGSEYVPLVYDSGELYTYAQPREIYNICGLVTQMYYNPKDILIRQTPTDCMACTDGPGIRNFKRCDTDGDGSLDACFKYDLDGDNILDSCFPPTCGPRDGEKIGTGQGPFAEGEHLILHQEYVRYEDSSELGPINRKLSLKRTDCSEINYEMTALWGGSFPLILPNGDEIQITPGSTQQDSDVYFTVDNGVQILYDSGEIYTYITESPYICGQRWMNYDAENPQDPSLIDPTDCAVAPTTTTTTIPLLPDLEVSKIVWAPESPGSSDKIAFTATIRNIGDAQVNMEIIRFYVDGKLHTYRGEVQTLNPGEYLSWETSASTAYPVGEHTIKVTVDETNQITEKDELNNELTRTFKVFPDERPDLEANRVIYYPANPTPDDNINIYSLVKNLEDVAAGAFRYTIQIDDAIVCDRVETMGLSPLDSVDISCGYGKYALGTHRVIATFDVDNDVGETDETNNMVSGSFTVSTNPQKPDLEMVSVETIPSNPGVGENVTIVATIRNNGPAKVAREITRFYVDDKMTTYNGHIEMLEAGQSITLKTLPSVLSRGVRKIRVNVDETNQVPEVDETNNEKEITLMVGGSTTTTTLISLPDLIVENLSFVPSSASTTDTVEVVSTLKNIGDETATLVGVSYFVNGRRWTTSPSMYTLRAGESVVNRRPLLTAPPYSPGAYDIRAHVDEIGRVTESNEDNNIMDKVLMVGATTTTTTIMDSPCACSQGDINICLNGGGIATTCSSVFDRDFMLYFCQEDTDGDGVGDGEMCKTFCNCVVNSTTTTVPTTTTTLPAGNWVVINDANKHQKGSAICSGAGFGDVDGGLTCPTATPPSQVKPLTADYGRTYSFSDCSEPIPSKTYVIWEMLRCKSKPTTTTTVPMPDLTVANLTWSPAAPLSTGLTVSIYCDFVNVGQAAASSFKISSIVNGEEVGPTLTKLNPGAHYILHSTKVIPQLGAGAFDVVCKIDPYDNVSESDESNNEMTRTMEIVSPIPTTTTIPAPFCTDGSVVEIRDVLDDNKVDKYSPDRSYGPEDKLEFYSVMTYATTRSYLKFDTSSLPINRPILDARLRLTSKSVYQRDNGRNDLVGVYYVKNDSWIQGDGYSAGNVAWPKLTWNNQPCGVGFTDSNNCNLVPDSTWDLSGMFVNRHIYFNIKQMLALDRGQGDGRLSLALKTEEPGDSDNVGVYVASKEAGLLPERPIIEVCLGTPVTTYPTTTVTLPSTTFPTTTTTVASSCPSGLAGSGTESDPCQVTECMDLTGEGLYYKLMNDIGSVGSPVFNTCFKILNNDISFDLDGKTVYGNNGDGVYIFNLDGVTIRDGVFTGFSNGIQGYSGEDLLIIGNTITVKNSGMYFYGVHGTVRSNIVRDSGSGLQVSQSDLFVVDNKLCGNERFDYNCSFSSTVIGTGNFIGDIATKCGSWPALGGNYQYCVQPTTTTTIMDLPCACSQGDINICLNGGGIATTCSSVFDRDFMLYFCQEDTDSDGVGDGEMCKTFCNCVVNSTTTTVPTTTTTISGQFCSTGTIVEIPNTIEDTYVAKGYPNRAYGGLSKTLNTYGYGPTYLDRSYLKFDLSTIPAGSSVSAARLNAYVTSVYSRTGGTKDTVGAYHVYNDNWTQGMGYNAGDVVWPQLTWNNQPCGTSFNVASQCNLKAESTVDISSVRVNTNVYFDVTNMVAKDVSERDDKITIALKSEEPGDYDNVGIYIGSREGTSSQRPNLEVCISPNAVSNTPRTTYPSTTVPTTYPMTTYPATTYPQTTYPMTTYPATTYPQTTYPLTTYPATTYPQTTYPMTTYPATTYPQTTYPMTTYPATTRPVTTTTMPNRCIDSDGPVAYNIAGYVIDPRGNQYMDLCSGSRYIKERYCSSEFGNSKTKIVKCIRGCQKEMLDGKLSGRCI